MKGPISEFTGKYRFLSNFYSSPFKDKKGRIWTTVEHYFQAHKTRDKKSFRAIRLSTSPSEAKQLGREVELRDDWETTKILVMKRAIRYKFWQNTPLRVKLLDTHPRELIEGNTWGDVYWGVCKGKGVNMLGFLLMQLRHEYKQIYNEGWDILYPYYECPVQNMKRVKQSLFQFDPKLLKPRGR